MTVANYPWTKTELLQILNTPVSAVGKRALRKRELAQAVAFYKAAVADALEGAAVAGGTDLDQSLQQVMARLDALAAGIERLLKAVERDEAESGIAA